MNDYKEQIERLRGFEIDHSPDGWPAIRMREISAMCNAVESLLAEKERLKHNLTTTEQTMREYQELAAKRLEEIAKYRDAPVAAYGVLEDQGNSVISWDAIAGWPEAAHEHINDAIQIWKDSGDFVPKYSVVPLIVKPGEEK